MKRILMLASCLCASVAGAQTLADVAKAVQGARREVIAVLPLVAGEDLAVALKQAAAKGTRVFLITERTAVRSGGYLLNVSHGPSSINTYLYGGSIGVPWVMVDGAWLVSGAPLDGRGQGSLNVTTDQPTLQRMNTWATAVTKAGPVPRVDLLKLRYEKSPPRQSR